MPNSSDYIPTARSKLLRNVDPGAQPPAPTLSLNALLVLAKVAEANSFSEGARRLRIPVSTVSRQVSDLETQLGVRLLERSTRSLRQPAHRS